MKKYKLIGTEKELEDNKFVYRPYYDNYMKTYLKDDYRTFQDLYCQINFNTKEVDFFICSLNSHRNHEFIKNQEYSLIQMDIYHDYVEIILELLDKKIISIVDEDETKTQ